MDSSGGAGGCTAPPPFQGRMGPRSEALRGTRTGPRSRCSPQAPRQGPLENLARVNSVCACGRHLIDCRPGSLPSGATSPPFRSATTGGGGGTWCSKTSTLAVTATWFSTLPSTTNSVAITSPTSVAMGHSVMRSPTASSRTQLAPRWDNGCCRLRPSRTVPPIVVTKDPLEWTGDRQAHTMRVLTSGSKWWTCKACGDTAVYATQCPLF